MAKPVPQFLVEYNGFTLPGYAQGESLEAAVQIQSYTAPYSYSPYSEYTGDQPKNISLTMLIWGEDYVDCKTQISRASTYLKSHRDGYAKLKIGNTDRYYQAIPQSIKYSKQSKDNQKLSSYDVSFVAMPYVESEDVTCVTGSSGTFTTSGRTIDSGMFTPCWISFGSNFSGGQVTISGFTATEFCGLVQITGTLPTGIYDISTEDLIAKDSSNNNIISYLNPDFSLFAGPGPTTFTVSGTTHVEISWRNRWWI